MIHKRVLIGSVIIAIALSMPFYGRTWHLFMHQLGAILFLGNIIVSALWLSLAKRSGSPDALRLGVEGILLTDAVFTTPGAILLGMNGGILGTDFFGAGARWLFISLALFLLTFIIWVAALLPAQVGMWRALERMPSSGPIPPEVERHFQKWFRFGGIATLLPLAALVLMVFKPSL